VRYTIETVTEPAEEPLSLAEVKTAIRVDGSDEDAFLSRLISTSRRLVEQWTGRALVSTEYRATYQAFPSGTSYYELPRTPVTEVGSIVYANSVGDSTTLDDAEYTVSLGDGMRRARIVPARLAWWPQTYGHIDDVAITFTAGYATADDVPAELRDLCWMLVDYCYQRPASKEEGSLGRNMEAALNLFLPTVSRPVLC
jgi:uncharacterized phiE125 gp8 family phage protein